MAVPYECRGCHRPVPTGNLYHGYGVVCATRRGLVPKRRRVRVRQPAKTGVEQPVLFDLDEIETNDESEEPMTEIETETKTELWAVHVQGPDDIVAAADRTDADRLAAEINEVAEQMMGRPDASPNDPHLHAVVVPWDGRAEHHAEALAEQQKDGAYVP